MLRVPLRVARGFQGRYSLGLRVSALAHTSHVGLDLPRSVDGGLRQVGSWAAGLSGGGDTRRGEHSLRFLRQLPGVVHHGGDVVETPRPCRQTKQRCCWSLDKAVAVSLYISRDGISLSLSLQDERNITIQYHTLSLRKYHRSLFIRHVFR